MSQRKPLDHDLTPPMICKSGDMFVAREGRFLATLGSCIAVILVDVRQGIAGINHYLLPDRQAAGPTNSLGSFSFGDESIRELLRRMKDEGCHRTNLRAWLVGGAHQMPNQQGVGEANLKIAEKVLRDFGIPVVDRHVGGLQGRRVEYRIDDGSLNIWMLGSDHEKNETRPAPKRRLGLDSLIERFSRRPPKLITIGSSTGGVEVITHLLEGVGPQLPPLLIVQHMPPVFTAEYAQRLDMMTSLRVKEAQRGERPQRGHVYLAPGGKQMKLKYVQDCPVIDVNDDAPVNLFKPSVDYLFNSVVQTPSLAPHTLAILLTGMGDDGAAGLRDLKNQGAVTVTQSSASCLVYGMPRAADELGASMSSLNPLQINQLLKKLSRAA